ncbi:hypothetical protein GCM10009675_23220 [Prauserella alba]|uniref:Uncharacterized protein n=1 Tax=Prauserella alba TaxID=176898 RepID=A0ABN1VBZ3_9PSEU
MAGGRQPRVRGGTGRASRHVESQLNVGIAIVVLDVDALAGFDRGRPVPGEASHSYTG